MPNDDSLLQQVLQKQAAMEQSIKDLSGRMDDQKSLTESVQKLALASVEMAGKITSLTDKVTKIDRDVEEMKCKPAKRWDGLVSTLITLAVGAIFGYLVTHAGLK